MDTPDGGYTRKALENSYDRGFAAGRKEASTHEIEMPRFNVKIRTHDAVYLNGRLLDGHENFKPYAMTDQEILDEYNATLGPAFGHLPKK